ncbi:MAG: hypothetical protein FD126_2513, partial [Elusimicrobia bacterium]
ADGRAGAFSGSAAGSAAAAWAMGERWTFLPTLSGSWSGVESALDTAGGTTLFSESMDHRAGLKAVYQPEKGRWRLKPSLGWRAKLLKETEDEDWLKGLFDHHILDLGVDWEYAARGGAGLRAGFAVSRTLFPNFSSLESTAPRDSRGRPLARELAGSRVLDSDAKLLTAAAWTPLARGFRADGRVGLELRDFYDQKRVRPDGLLSDDTRGDFTTTVEAGLSHERELRLDRVLALGVDVAVANVRSDQASFDPARGRYEPHHYDHTAWSVAPSAGLKWGDLSAPAALTAALRFGARSWPHRSARDGVGAYSGSGLREENLSAAFDGRWPFGPGLALTARLERRWSSSNDGYEAAHRFNHEATSFLLGVAFER